MIRFSIILLSLISSACYAGGDLLFDFSFGEHLYLYQSGQRVSLTVNNPTDQHISCEAISLLDGGSPHFIEARVALRPLEGGDDCFGGNCVAFISPPPSIVIWGSVGPYAPYESKTCEFEVVILHDFEGTIGLQGSVGPIMVTRVHDAVPALSVAALIALFCTILLGGRYYILRSRKIA